MSENLSVKTGALSLVRFCRLPMLLAVVSAFWLSASVISPAQAEYVNTLNRSQPTLNMRSGPGTGSEILTELQLNTLVRVIGSSGNWRRVQLADGSRGWVHGRYLGSDTIDYFPPFVATHRISGAKRGFMNLRAGPSTSFDVIARSYENDDLMATGAQQAGWLQVQLPDFTTAWVFGSGVKALRTDQTANSTNTDTNGVAVTLEITRPTGEGATPTNGSSAVLPLAIYCQPVDPLSDYVCRSRGLTNQQRAVDGLIADTEPTLTAYDRRRLEFSQIRFGEILNRACKIPAGEPAAALTFERTEDCLSELYRLRVWQLGNRYLDNYVTPDNATIDDAAPYFGDDSALVIAVPQQPTFDDDFTPSTAGSSQIGQLGQIVDFAPTQRLARLLIGMEVLITSASGDEVERITAEIPRNGPVIPAETVLPIGSYRVDYKLYYVGGASDSHTGRLRVDGPASCTLSRRAFSCDPS